MTETNISVRANGITLEPCRHNNTVWIELRDGKGELLNIAIFVQASMAEKVERACMVFNGEMEWDGK